MSEPRCHVVFSPSDAGALKRALEMAGRSDQVLCPFDDFSFGPIATDDARTRIEWLEEELDCGGWEDITDKAAAFLAASSASSATITAWLCRRHAGSHAGFLWWLSNVGDTPVLVNEVPEMPSMNAEALVDFLDRAVPLQAEERARYQARWQQLKVEDAPLRVIEGEELVSAPIEHFDADLLGYATPEWQRMVKIVVGPLIEYSNAGLSQVGDLVLSSRLTRLAEAGKLERRGDFPHMQRCELRLPAVQ